MGLIAQFDRFRQNISHAKIWYTPWLSSQTGGALLITSTLFLMSAIGTIAIYTTYTENGSKLQQAKKELEYVKGLFFLDEQYQASVENKSHSQLSSQHAKFIQPTTFAAMKAQLKKWQMNLRIKTLNVTIGAATPYNRGNGILSTSIHLTAHVLNDKTLYQLLDKLKNEAPGHIVIRHIDLKRVASPSSEIIDQLISGKTTSLIEGVITCDWFFIGAHD
ncbi:MAG: hypothetical protein V4482_06270 [Pseudomonadota bacterium]